MPASSKRTSPARAGGCCTPPPCSPRRHGTTTREHGEDPYDHTRQYLATRFANSAWHELGGLLRSRPHSGSPLAALSPQERLVLVLRLHEGVAEEQTAALLGLPAERVRAIFNRAMVNVLRPPRSPSPKVAGVEAVPS